ncbi:gametocyte-specific factor 1-like [Vespa crabro]|uniref:gametocyte-specific factor 1-like n=1 Tax=Vespa crabro TaxID=7445 RepID=UPI001F02B98F|nr:gametocyte-specific factor 1-like [Vespa crabro]XP_046824702.1 gametocyte-specific factor 1-like [Vespa crabro]
MYEPLYIDTTVTCPYNENHRIARSRIQRHIVKCEKNYPNDYKMICPYNATHRLFKHEMMEHIITCPMRKLIDPELYQRTGNRALLKNKLQCDITSLIDCNESWDKELDSNSISHIKKNLHFDIRKCNTENYKDLRRPRGFSEVMLIDVDEETNVEDMESITSSMGMGRGKINANKNYLIQKIGLGRGKILH